MVIAMDDHTRHPRAGLAPRKGRARAAGAATLDSRGNDRITDDGSARAALYRLVIWLSPSYPVGAFSYSSGIEWAVEAGDISDVVTLRDWLAAMLADGIGFCDAVLLAHAWRAAYAKTDLYSVAELAAAFTPTRERYLETTAQGGAFLEATRASWPCAAIERLAQCRCVIAYPVAVGVAAAGHDIPIGQALPAYLQALLSNWTSAGMRLVPLGQTDGQRILAALEGVVASTAERALGASLDDMGSSVFRADLASARHETQYTRLFRS